jgi:tetratricopeptide (TPR) repeat protein
VALKFKLLDVPVVIGGDFLLIMLLLGALWRTPEQLPAWMVIVTGSVLLHEFGHATLFDFFGFKPMIRLYGGGGVTMAMTTTEHRISPWRHIVIAAAGPVTGLILGGAVGLAVLASPRIGSSDIVEDLLWVSLGWSVINLLPFPGTDGGSIVTELTAIVMRRPAEAMGRVIGLIAVGAVFVALLAVGLYDWAFIIGFFAVFNFARMGFRLGGTQARGPATSAMALMQAGRYQEAFNAARLAMTDRPADPVPTVIASDALRLMSRYKDSEWGYDKLLTADPTNARALRGRANTRRHLGRDAEADADLRTLLSLPRDGAVVSQAAGLYDADRHEEGYNLVLAALPNVQNPVIVRILQTFVAMFEYSTGREAAGLGHIDELLRATPDDPAMREQRALILIDLGRFGEAIDDARRSLALMPQHPSYLETFAIAVRMSGDAATALQSLNFSTGARPGDPRARAELALCQLQLGQMGEVRAALETLPRYASGDPFVVYAWAAVAAAKGEADQAIKFLTEAGRLRPELGVRAGVDPLFRTLLSDPARRAALAAPAA